MKIKTIIALYGRQNSGKTTILKILAELLDTEFPNATYELGQPVNRNQPGEIRIALVINGIKVGIASQGDNAGWVRSQVTPLVDLECDIIFCASRTRGGSVRTVNQLARDNNYERIWTAPYEPSDDDRQEDLNDLKARHLLDLVRELNLL